MSYLIFTFIYEKYRERFDLWLENLENIGQQIYMVSCYLKVSCLSRHKKYRFCKGGQVNFEQLRRQLLVVFPPEVTVFVITKPHMEETEIRMTESQLSQFLKNMEFQANATLKIRVMEDQAKARKKQTLNEEDEDSISIPQSIDRQRSKSEEIHFQQHTSKANADFDEVTQQFLRNSTFNYAEKKTSFCDFGWILKDLQKNANRRMLVLNRKKLTNISALYQRLKTNLREQDDFVS